jgi:O-antigen/teichoic acid export membrane protein
MTDDTRIEELSQKVRKLQQRFTWVMILLVVLLILNIITYFPILVAEVRYDPAFPIMAVACLIFAVLLAVCYRLIRIGDRNLEN